MTAGAGPTPPLVDTHAHLAAAALGDDLDAVLGRAWGAGLVAIVAVATTVDDSAAVARIAEADPRIRPTAGIHPNEAHAATEADWAALDALARSPGVAALGETGLDRHWDHTPFDVQRDAFDRHLDLAEALGLPLVIHCRRSEADILDQLSRRRRPVRGVLHSFVGDRSLAARFLDLGLDVSIAGQVTFGNASLGPLREAARFIPADRLLVETDSPYLSPEPFRGRRNEPARVAHTLAKIATLRDDSIDALARSTTANARRLFGINVDPTGISSQP